MTPFEARQKLFDAASQGAEFVHAEVATVVLACSEPSRDPQTQKARDLLTDTAQRSGPETCWNRAALLHACTEDEPLPSAATPEPAAGSAPADPKRKKAPADAAK